MDFYIVITAIAITIGLWNLMIAILSLFPHFLSTAVGTLTHANTKRNIRGRRGSLIPVLTRYVYTYIVNGKEYRYSGAEMRTKRHLLPKASMVYVKWFPRRAYPNKFKGTNEWTAGITLLFIGTLLALLLAAA